MATQAATKPWFVENSPELGGLFAQFYEGCKTKGVLDKKTKELLMLSLASVFRCPHCTKEHVQAALEAGASKQEITEALLIAAVEGAGTQLAWQKETFMELLG